MAVRTKPFVLDKHQNAWRTSIAFVAAAAKCRQHTGDPFMKVTRWPCSCLPPAQTSILYIQRMHVRARALLVPQRKANKH